MLDISEPTRQSKLTILLYLFKNIKSLLAIVFFAVFGLQSLESTIVSLMLVGFFTFTSLISPVLKYLFFTFHIEKDELIIKKGWLFKERKAIPIERIQSINITQNVGQRLLGIVAIDIETAGSKAKELEIPGLERPFAEQLKELLSSKKTSVTDIVMDETKEQLSDVSQLISIKREILKLNIIDLLKVGLTQNHLRSGGLALGVVVGFWYKIKDVLERYFSDLYHKVDTDMDAVVSVPQEMNSSLWLLIAGVLIVFIIVSIIVSLITVINKFFNYRMVLVDDTLEISMGLLNKREVKIPLSKIQILEFHSNPLRKLLGYKTAKIFQAQSQNSRLTHVQVPACKKDLQKELQYLIFNEPLENPEITLPSSPWSHARLNVYIFAVFAVPLITLAIYLNYTSLILVPIVFMLFIGFLGFQYGKHSRVSRDDDFIVFYKGWLFNSTIISPVYKTQAIEKWRSIFIKRRGEAHLKVHTAGGSRQLKYLKEKSINSMQDDINNTVIQSTRHWM